MAEPLVFQFKPGADGHPQVMYIADLECACGLCKHPQLQRFYHSTPFHTLTLERLDRLAARLHAKAGYACENCGEAVGPDDVGRATLTYGFPDDAGLIRIFVADPQDDDPELTYALVPERRLDPQELPGFDAQDTGAAARVFESVDESIVEEVFGRAFSPKLLWIELIADWTQDPEGGAYARAGDGYWFIVDADEDLASDLAEEIDDDEFIDGYDAGDLMVIPLADSTPAELATHAHPDRIPGRWQTWLPRKIRDELADATMWAEAYVSRQAVIAAMARTFELARLDWQLDRTDADVFFHQITTPGQGVYGRGVSVTSVIRRAVCTGITPGEAARLTAEEIAGVLLGVWKPDDHDSSLPESEA